MLTSRIEAASSLLILIVSFIRGFIGMAGRNMVA